MRDQRRQLALVVVLLLSLLLSGCASEVALPADAEPELRAGADVYRARCASCHGADGAGAIGPSLSEIETRLDDNGQREIVVTGRNAMPSFGNTLSESDIDAVVRYTREIL
jgi:mono/diheme cytochrome c family protein